ncbi:hypothetical protein P7C73_g2583, partial [Tremellales sp. Uapishka_1]
MSVLERTGSQAFSEKGLEASIQVVDVEPDFSPYQYTREEEKALVSKFDWRILPIIWWCYIFNSLDRSNVGNAKSDGMTTDLHFPKNGYTIMLSIFYVPFCTLVVPGVMLTRKVGPQWTLPGYMIGWGSLAMINAACKDFGSAVAVRFLLGVFEAGFAASLIFYLTNFYTRGELGKRVAAFYSCNALSGAFSGLIAYGVFQMDSKLWGWQILFLIEGAFTVAFAIVTAIFLPTRPASWGALTDRQKEIARLRLLKDGSSSTDAPFKARTFFKPLWDWKFYVYGAIALCYGTAAAVAGNFLTQIIGRFEFSTVKTNLYTVAPFVCGTIVLLVTSWSSDRFRERGFHLASSLVFVIIGCVILVALPTTSIHVGYFATFLITFGSFTPSVLFHTWHQCNDPSEDGRAFRVGALTFLANTGGIVSTNIFLDKFKPKYTVPLAITAGIEALGLVLILGLRMWMWNDNRKRNKAQGVNWQSKDVPTEALAEGPANPSFRHFY